MVGHQHVESALARIPMASWALVPQSLVTSRSASASRARSTAPVGQSESVGHSIGNPGGDPRAQAAQDAGPERGRRDPVDIVVARRRRWGAGRPTTGRPRVTARSQSVSRNGSCRCSIFGRRKRSTSSRERRPRFQRTSSTGKGTRQSRKTSCHSAGHRSEGRSQRPLVVEELTGIMMLPESGHSHAADATTPGDRGGLAGSRSQSPDARRARPSRVRRTGL